MRRSYAWVPDVIPWQGNRATGQQQFVNTIWQFGGVPHKQEKQQTANYFSVTSCSPLTNHHACYASYAHAREQTDTHRPTHLNTSKNAYTCLYAHTVTLSNPLQIDIHTSKHTPSHLPTHLPIYLHVWLSSLATTHCSDTTQGSHIDLPFAYILSSSQVFTWPYSPAFLCHLSSSAALTWPSWSLCLASEDFYGSDTSLCNHWPFALEPTPSFYSIHFTNWLAKCLFSFSQDCSLLSGSLALEALLIGVHCKKRYINV